MTRILVEDRTVGYVHYSCVDGLLRILSEQFYWILTMTRLGLRDVLSIGSGRLTSCKGNIIPVMFRFLETCALDCCAPTIHTKP